MGSREKEGGEDKTLKGDLKRSLREEGNLGTKDREGMEIDPLSWKKR